LPDTHRTSDDRRITPPAPTDVPASSISTDTWGFRDTRFAVDASGAITVTGSRYPGLSGEVLPELLPWFRKVIGVDFEVKSLVPLETPVVPAPLPAAGFLAAIRERVSADRIVTDAETRVRHGHGHTVAEMDAIRGAGFPRVPDYVVFPNDEREVELLVQAAQQHHAVLMPYGGGTNVTEALRCLPQEERPIISVDMSHMNRIEWIDPVNRTAKIQAGAAGRIIQDTLAKFNYTMGHEPDSVEFSTLGGWIATNASGMKKNRYGNIEDIVLDVTVVSTAGKLERSQVVPRESIGLDPKLWIIGSEGSLGIITSAVVKLFPLPEERRYGSIVFKTFEQGLAFMYDLAQEDVYPASVRLMDNLQFQFGQALKPTVRGAKALKRKFEKWLVLGPLGFDANQMVAATLVYEGTRPEVERQAQVVAALRKKHGGMDGGAENGRRGYTLTFGIAYIRDFVLANDILAESFETSVPWSRARDLVERVCSSIHDTHAALELPGRPFISARVTQLYETGCCIYFYMAFYAKGVENAMEKYHDIESRARQAVLAAGGSISHHHGVGKLRLRFIPDIMSPAMVQWRETMKNALDPQGVFAAQTPLESDVHAELAR
jgi:alkyldihydroxyacetonephosphate synthase